MASQTRVSRGRIEDELFEKNRSGSLAYGVSVDNDGRRSVNGPFFQDMQMSTLALRWKTTALGGDLDREDVLDAAAILLRARFVECAKCDLSDVALDLKVENDTLYCVTGALSCIQTPLRFDSCMLLIAYFLRD